MFRMTHRIVLSATLQDRLVPLGILWLSPCAAECVGLCFGQLVQLGREPDNNRAVCLIGSARWEWTHVSSFNLGL